MAFGMARDVLRPTDSSRADRVTYFDLMFVLALTQLSAYLFENQTPLGGLEGIIMVCALWWAWVSTTWVTNWLDPVTLPVRGAVVTLGFVALVMSVSIAEAFGDRVWAFALSYVVLQVVRTAFIVWATLRHDRRVARDSALILGWTDPKDWARERDIYFRRANASLDEAIQSDPNFARWLEEQSEGIGERVAQKGGRNNPYPDMFIWPHSHADTVDGRYGVMQLVPTYHHWPGSIFWSELHPENKGGFFVWGKKGGS